MSSPVTVPTSLLGKPSDDPAIEALISAGNGKPPKLPRGEVRADVELKGLGVSLEFVDEGFHTKNAKLARGEGALLLATIFYFPDGYQDYTGYAGVLPEGLDFSMNQAAARAKLGQSEWDDKDLCTEGWNVDGNLLCVGYTDAFDALVDVSVQLPEHADPE